MTHVDRRSLLLGSAALLVAGCSGGQGEKKPEKPKGPNIVKPRTGTVVTAEDTAALRDKLNAALRSGDVQKMLDLLEPDAVYREEFEKRWTRRLANFERLGFVDGEWYVGMPGGRTRNAAGGKVEYSGELVFAHTVQGCDAQQVVENASADFRKKSEDAPLELLNIGDVDADFDPSIWDVADVDAIGTKHAWIVFRKQDAKRAKAAADTIEAGAKRAFGLMPRPQGVEKVFYALTWPEVDGRLYGRTAIGDALAHAYYHPFLDPEVLARGQKKPVSTKDLPKATGRVGLHQAAFGQDLEKTSCHEAVHILANQWLRTGVTPTWAVEGLARWADLGPGSGRLMSSYGGSIRSSFAAFQKVAPKGYDEFHDSPLEGEFYLCSAAIYEYLDRTKGRDAVFETAEAFYSATTRKEAAQQLGRSEKDLIAATRTWLRA